MRNIKSNKNNVDIERKKERKKERERKRKKEKRKKDRKKGRKKEIWGKESKISWKKEHKSESSDKFKLIVSLREVF